MRVQICWQKWNSFWSWYRQKNHQLYHYWEKNLISCLIAHVELNFRQRPAVHNMVLLPGPFRSSFHVAYNLIQPIILRTILKIYFDHFLNIRRHFDFLTHCLLCVQKWKILTTNRVYVITNGGIITALTLIVLMWRIEWAHNNARK